jgi:hypothetical protein
MLRDVSAERLIQSLYALKYTVTRQRSSHIRITTIKDSEHHEVVSNHNPMQSGHYSAL